MLSRTAMDSPSEVRRVWRLNTSLLLDSPILHKFCFLPTHQTASSWELFLSLVCATADKSPTSLLSYSDHSSLQPALRPDK